MTKLKHLNNMKKNYDAKFKQLNKKNVRVKTLKGQEEEDTTSLLARVAYIAMNPATKK